LLITNSPKKHSHTFTVLYIQVYITQSEHFCTSTLVQNKKLWWLFKILVKCVYRRLSFLAFCYRLAIRCRCFQPTNNNVHLTACFIHDNQCISTRDVQFSSRGQTGPETTILASTSALWPQHQHYGVI